MLLKDDESNGHNFVTSVLVAYRIQQGSPFGVCTGSKVTMERSSPGTSLLVFSLMCS